MSNRTEDSNQYPPMALPYLRTRSLVQAQALLFELSQSESFNVPLSVKESAQLILKHFPTLQEIQLIHEALPALVGPAPPFNRLSGSLETISVINATRDAEL